MSFVYHMDHLCVSVHYLYLCFLKLGVDESIELKKILVTTTICYTTTIDALLLLL